MTQMRGVTKEAQNFQLPAEAGESQNTPLQNLSREQDPTDSLILNVEPLEL